MYVSITTIINNTLQTGELPNSLKLATVMPNCSPKLKKIFIFIDQCQYYRLYIKILENIIHKRLYHFLLTFERLFGLFLFSIQS